MEGTTPHTLYAVGEDGAHIAYQVVGDASTNVVVTANSTPIDMIWEEPRLARALERLARTCRVIVFDRRGTGSSDPVRDEDIGSWDTALTDLVAVMDATACATAAILTTDCAGVAVSAATAYPERLSAVLLLNSYARLSRAPDYPIGLPERVLNMFLEYTQNELSQSIDIAFDNGYMVGDRASDPIFRQWYFRAMRSSGGPRGWAGQGRVDFFSDVRDRLPEVRLPTLCLHSAGDAFVRPAHGRFVADHIEGARFVELPGAGHYLATVDLDALVDEVAGFLTGVRPKTRTDRVVTTVLFTDIVGSTERAAVLGDRAWRDLLDRHRSVVRGCLDQYGGREVDTAGDGFLAVFGGAARAVVCACAISKGLGVLGIEVRAGLHVGEVETDGGAVAGIAVHIAARVMSAAQPSEVLVSRTVADVCTGSGVSFLDRGLHQLKGVAGTWQLYSAQAG